MDQYVAPVVWSPATRDHEPRHEIWVGVATEGTEVAARVDTILEALGAAGHRLVRADAHSDDVLREVHHAELLDFLATSWSRWDQGPYAALVGQECVVPYLFPTPAMTGGLPARPAVAVHVEAGRFAYDTMTLIGPGTWSAVRAAAHCAQSAALLVAGGERVAYALCRPPGHHATHTGFGGSCYLNNAAVAAQTLRGQGFARVGIIDVDAHHGNGTAAIFYHRSDVLYGSVHIDPAAGWFPHIVGFADEVGLGDGEGATRNIPVQEGTSDGGWLEAVHDLIEWTSASGCAALVVSLGVDAAEDDPESPLLVTVDGYREAGRLAGASGLPMVIVQEGGYHLPTLGGLVAAYLSGHAVGASSYDG